MGKCDKALHGCGGVSGPALCNNFFNVCSSSCQYPIQIDQIVKPFFGIFHKHFNDKLGVFVKTNVTIGGCTCLRYEVLQGGGGVSKTSINSMKYCMDGPLPDKRQIHYNIRHSNLYPLPISRMSKCQNSLIPWGLYNWQ